MAMRLRRRCENSELISNCPQMSALFNGSDADRLKLLRQWLNSGEVMEKCEHAIEITKSVENLFEGEEHLLTVAEMRKHGVSESLGSFLLSCSCIAFTRSLFNLCRCHQPRKKIAVICATQRPILDPQCPEVEEEARFWVTILQKRVTKKASKMEYKAHAKVKANADAIDALTSGIGGPSSSAAGAVDMSRVLAGGGLAENWCHCLMRL